MFFNSELKAKRGRMPLSVIFFIATAWERRLGGGSGAMFSHAGQFMVLPHGCAIQGKWLHQFCLTVRHFSPSFVQKL